MGALITLVAFAGYWWWRGSYPSWGLAVLGLFVALLAGAIYLNSQGLRLNIQGDYLAGKVWSMQSVQDDSVTLPK